MKEKIKNMLDITFWKFVLVGIVNTLVGTGVMEPNWKYGASAK